MANVVSPPYVLLVLLTLAGADVTVAPLALDGLAPALVGAAGPGKHHAYAYL
ncbi:MAG: hypothetical protein IT331_18090 [Anaerolineae bacterium]|nr:hypothetical protein [Anaerolineae bacterium]